MQIKICSLILFIKKWIPERLPAAELLKEHLSVETQIFISLDIWGKNLDTVLPVFTKFKKTIPGLVLTHATEYHVKLVGKFSIPLNHRFDSKNYNIVSVTHAVFKQ